MAAAPDGPARRIPAPVLIVLAALTGCVGGIYGIGGGAILSTAAQFLWNGLS